ncbi:MAG: tyrosine-type recombinase/integrase [Armatimonadetes bacterium]|nr:tyrosine-type recombinase/integrase [Armatimonadota bacterium]
MKDSPTPDKNNASVPTPGRGPSPSFQELLHRFDEELARLDRSALTRRHYLTDLHRFAAWVEDAYHEPFSLPLITARDIAGYKSHLQTEKGLKPQTVNRKLAALSSFFRWAHQNRLLSEDPTARIKGVKETRTAPKALERTELNRLLRKAGEPRTADMEKRPWRDIAVVAVLLHTGLRVGELCALQRSDVSLSDRKGTITVRSGKGRKYREVPLNADVRKALQDYLERRKESASEFLFLSQKGGALTPSAVWRIVKTIGKAAGVELSPHTLRHTFGTNLVRAGTDLVSVATLLGHESLNTTAIYTRPSRRHLAQEVQKLSTLGEEEA